MAFKFFNLQMMVFIKYLREAGHTVYDCTAEGYSANNNLYRIAREMLKTINVDVDKYVGSRGDKELAKKWEETNTMLLEQFEVSVYKVNENGNTGDVVFLIKGYDEEALNKHLNENLEKYTH